MKPTLLILAAGLGSRFGGLKQLEEIGPNGEIIMDYSIHDALKAGFKEVVLIVQESMIPILTERYIAQKKLPVSFVIQENILKINNAVYENTKPWGTAYALWCARKKIKGNFLLINADDFYGQNSFALAYSHLSQNTTPCAIVFPVYKTLSQNGTVNRAEIQMENGMLINSSEREKIEFSDEGIFYPNENGQKTKLEKDTLVSMNMWGFTSEIFNYLEDDLSDFIVHWKTNQSLEYQLPNVVAAMTKKEIYQVKIIPTDETWIGITYQEDKEIAAELLQKLHLDGTYKTVL